MDINKILGEKSPVHRRILDSPNVLGKDSKKENNNKAFTDRKMSDILGKNPVSSFIGKTINNPLDKMLGKKQDKEECDECEVYDDEEEDD